MKWIKEHKKVLVVILVILILFGCTGCGYEPAPEPKIEKPGVETILYENVITETILYENVSTYWDDIK